MVHAEVSSKVGCDFRSVVRFWMFLMVCLRYCLKQGNKSMEVLQNQGLIERN